MNVLVFNCGSSSLKYKLIALPGERQLAGGEAQRVGPPTAEPSRILHHTEDGQETHVVEMHDHASAFEQVMKVLARNPELMPDAIGHRMVHGGEWFKDHAVVSEAVIQNLELTVDMAPLHNPPAIALVKACLERYPELPQVVVFDTAFHSTIPDYAATYALPRAIRQKLGIRKYGFHGTSHQFVVAEAARLLGRPLEQFNAVSCHLGSGGASLCAIRGGCSVDNTMGFSPLQGLMMSTRCGDLDPAVTMKLLARSQGDYKAVEKLLNKQSGVLGLSGSTADIRDVLAGIEKGAQDRAQMERVAQVYLWRIRKYLGAYLTVVGDAEAVIFTDTIGETVPKVRWAVCSDMDYFGLKIDPDRNRAVGTLPADVATADSPIRILVIATNEELAIARQTHRLLAKAA